MSKKLLIISLVVIVVAVAAVLLVWYFTSEETINVKGNSNESTNAAVIARERPPKNTVWIKNGNFNPSVITISVGETITWVNKDEVKRKVAADPHPTSSTLPELVSDELNKGDTYKFTFKNKGKWYYHDYLNPIKKGKIVVE